jgi:anti-anti-sigma regulatory factor
MFRQAIRDQVAQDNKNILLNLEAVSYIDSSGLGELVLGHGTVTQNICDSCGGSVFQNDRGDWDPCPQCDNKGRTTWGRLKLTNLNSQVRELMEFSRLNTVFDIHESEESALGSF